MNMNMNMKKSLKKSLFAVTILLASVTSAHLAAAHGDKGDHTDNMKYNLKVNGMFCDTCAVSSKKALMKVDGIKSVDVDVKAGRVTVCAAPGTRLDDAFLKQVFLQKGFSYKSKTEAGSC